MNISVISNLNFHKYPPESVGGSFNKSMGVSFGARKLKATKDSFEKVSNISKSNFTPLVFREAKTVSDAKIYGRKVLGIKDYRGFCEKTDLAVINWINESFAAVHNASKGKAIRPFLIDYYNYVPEEKNWYGAMEFTVPLGEISFNRDFLQNIDSRIKTKIITAASNCPIICKDNILISDYSRKIKSKDALVPCILKTKNGEYELSSLFAKNKNAGLFEQNLNKYLNNPSGYSFKDKISLNFTLNNILNKKYDYFKNYEEQKSPKPELTFSIVSPYKCIAHESGHLQHFSSDKKYAEFAQDDVVDKKKIIWRKFIDGEEKTAAKITAYAASSPYEFVAETFAELVCNPKVRLEDDVIALYKRHNGPIFFQ